MIASPSQILRNPVLTRVLPPKPVVVPRRCRKCGTVYFPRRVDTTNMAAGLRFAAGGIQFSGRGENFIKDDGTCPNCDCDNPPGSGKNFTFCPTCPGSQGPA